jgi:predicted signal transduction protein with EAL and GGDEF domain
MALAYILWSLALAPHGGPSCRPMSGPTSTTVIGCIFCLLIPPQAALVVASPSARVFHMCIERQN